VAFWFALAIFLFCLAVGIAYLVVRALQLWREAKRVGGVIGTEVDRVSAGSERIEDHLANADAAGGRLKEAAGRLAVSRTKLQVQIAAVREARAQLRRVFWFVPGI
jgi:hypothetical protein